MTFVLDPPAHVVDGHVGEADGVEVVEHHGGVAELGEQSVGVAPEGVEGHDVDAGQPLLEALGEPVVDGLAAATRDDVEQAGLGQLHEAGHVGGAPMGGRRAT